MTQELQQTANSETPPVPTFRFKPGPKKQPKVVEAKDGDKDQETSGSPGMAKRNKSSSPKVVRVKQREGKKETDEARQQFQAKRYVNLSTKARRSIQQALSELSHIRKKAKRPSTIKCFIEESLSEWSKSPRSKIDFAPKSTEVLVANEDDPRQTFNNEIEEELKNVVGDICHERGKIGHPVRTMIAILDDAFCQWFPKQQDLPTEYVDAVLKASQ